MSAPTWQIETDTCHIRGRTALYKDQDVIGVMSDEALVLCLCGHASRNSYAGQCCRCAQPSPLSWCNICKKARP